MKQKVQYPLLQAWEKASRAGNKQLLVLVDPDKADDKQLEELATLTLRSAVAGFLVGGSLITEGVLDETVARLKQLTNLPVVLFPGSALQVSTQADAILFLSLISGRNPEYLIGQQVRAAHLVRQSGIEVMPTGYLLIDGGKPTSASYISHTHPIPADKPDIAGTTALAGELLGLRCTYLDAGSGARQPVSAATIKAVRKVVAGPLLVGGGIRTPEAAARAAQAGADFVVVGNVLEKEPELVRELSAALSRVVV